MTVKFGGKPYLPGTYIHRKPGSDEIGGHYIRALEHKEITEKADLDISDESERIFPCICFSRKIGVGALEIADLVAQQLEYKVVDRELIEQIAKEKNISQRAVAFFDERFPGYANKTFTYLFGEKSFLDSDYSRCLTSVVYTFAEIEPTIFVGRETHLILPRHRTMAVRCICSDEYRAWRIARIMKVDVKETRKKLIDIDKEQNAFLKKVFGKKQAEPDEFDIVLNLDYIDNPQSAADIIVIIYKKKFAG